VEIFIQKVVLFQGLLILDSGWVVEHFLPLFSLSVLEAMMMMVALSRILLLQEEKPQEQGKIFQNQQQQF
jgi:hypothetical protein